MSYNKAACDSKDANYASGRLDFQPYYANLDVDREDGNDLVLDPLFETWFDLCIQIFGWLGGNPKSVGATARYHIWDWPKHNVADIQAEADANRTRLESGQIFIHRLFSDAGMDFEDEVEAAATAFGKTVEEVKTRLFDVIFPLPKAQRPISSPIKDPAMAAVLSRFLNGAPVNGNGAHHAN
jgi:hypothetical protein